MSAAIVSIERLTKIYKTGSIAVNALDDIDLTIERGEFTAIAGPSGSGKTTLLNVMSGLDVADSGRVVLGGKSIGEISGRVLSNFRRDHIGFIFQAYNLIPVLTVKENIEYVMLLQGIDAVVRRERVFAILQEVGLLGMEKRRPFELSGGQQQRVAVARAMVTMPDIILADEPTANLDSHSGAALLELMHGLNREKGMTFIFSTHDEMIMRQAQRLIRLKDGRLESDERR